MKTYRALGLLALSLSAFLGCAVAADLPVAVPVDPATVSPVAASSLPPSALLIAVVVPLLIAGLKKLFPKIPGAVLPVLAPVLGGLIEAIVTSLGHDAGGLVTGAVAGSAGVGLREIADQNRKRLPGAAAALCFLCSLLFLGVGCTSFRVVQGDKSPDREITFELTGRAWFSGQQAITQLKAIQTDKSQSFGTDSINQKGPTNAVALIEATTKLLNAAKP